MQSASRTTGEHIVVFSKRELALAIKTAFDYPHISQLIDFALFFSSILTLHSHRNRETGQAG
jgi:hypothetical protein